MNEFAIVRLPLGNAGSTTEKFTLDNLRNLPGSGNLSQMLKKIVDGELEFARETKNFRQFKLKCKFYGRKVSISPDVPTYSGEFDVWQHKGGLAMTVGPSMILSRIAAAFLSASLYGEVDYSIELFELKPENFSLLKELIMKLGGEVTMLHLVGIKNTNYRVLTVTGKKLEETEMWGLVDKANKIRRIGFRVPIGGELFSFWVASWGGGSVYQPSELLPHHISNFLNLLEKALLPRGTSTK